MSNEGRGGEEVRRDRKGARRGRKTRGWQNEEGSEYGRKVYVEIEVELRLVEGQTVNRRRETGTGIKVITEVLERKYKEV